MAGRPISTESLCARFDTSSVVAQFIAGVIVGLLLGLALAPFLRSWLLWQQAKAWQQRDRDAGSTIWSDSENSVSTRHQAADDS